MASLALSAFGWARTAGSAPRTYVPLRVMNSAITGSLMAAGLVVVNASRITPGSPTTLPHAEITPTAPDCCSSAGPSSACTVGRGRAPGMRSASRRVGSRPPRSRQPASLWPSPAPSIARAASTRAPKVACAGAANARRSARVRARSTHARGPQCLPLTAAAVGWLVWAWHSPHTSRSTGKRGFEACAQHNKRRSRERVAE